MKKIVIFALFLCASFAVVSSVKADTAVASTETQETSLSLTMPLIGTIDATEFIKKCRAGINTDWSDKGTYLSYVYPKEKYVTSDGVELANFSYGVLYRYSDGKTGVTAGPMIVLSNLIPYLIAKNEYTSKHIVDNPDIWDGLQVGWSPRYEYVEGGEQRFNFGTFNLSYNFGGK